MHLDIHLSPAAREGKREAASPALLRRYGACDSFPFTSSFLAEGAPAGGRSACSWVLSCFNGQMECTVVCVHKYACTIWGGVEGKGGVRVNVAEAWARSQEQGAPRGMPWKNETEECRLH